MSEYAILQDAKVNDDQGRLTRLYRFLRDKPGSHKSIVMHWTGFDRINGLTEHVSFENAVLRLDRILRDHGQHIIRHENRFSLGGV